MAAAAWIMKSYMLYRRPPGRHCGGALKDLLRGVDAAATSRRPKGLASLRPKGLALLRRYRVFRDSASHYIAVTFLLSWLFRFVRGFSCSRGEASPLGLFPRACRPHLAENSPLDCFPGARCPCSLSPVPCSLFPVPCSLSPVPFVLPFAYPQTPRQIIFSYN